MKKGLPFGAIIGVLLFLCCRTYGSTAINLALWEATAGGNEKWAAQLLEQGADVNVTNDLGTTALMMASMKGHTRLVELLLKHGADVRARERDGSTALRWASEKGHQEIVRLLHTRLAETAKPEDTATVHAPSNPPDPPGRNGAGEVLQKLPPVLPITPIPANGSIAGGGGRVVLGAVKLADIPPLYTDPKLPGEGVWDRRDMPVDESGQPLIYRTVYRPSSDFPNAVVYMLVFDMKRVSMKLYLGTAEPGADQCASGIDRSALPLLVAITNGLWQTRHAGRAGIVCHGRVLKKMENGVASIVLFKNGSVDILKWNDQIPLSEVTDARQLKHLIVEDGKVVTRIRKGGKEVDAEIGLGSLLDEERPTIRVPAEEPSKEQWSLNFTSGPLWFIATRSAFGIRKDGNVVYALGHHIGTRDLAKALALAGCVRALHGDANPGNSVGLLYFMEDGGKIANGVRLSPHLDPGTVKRYLGPTYPKDFFGYFRRPAAPEQASSQSGLSSPAPSAEKPGT
ncbi:MAG: ankyrin repeat domain-containing protein [Pseudomonadota bacterium]